MRWFKKHLGNVGIASICMLFLLTCLALLPLSAASVHVGASGVATPTIITLQATPTEDATVTALNKEKLALEVRQLQEQNEPDLLGWLRGNASPLFSTLLVVGGGIFGLLRYLAERRDSQKRLLEDRQAERDRQDEEQKRWLKNQGAEREKQAEERFQSAVTGLGDEKEGGKIGAAILLRTFLRPGYEQFYPQTFDLTVAHLRLLRASKLSNDSSAPPPPTTLDQILIQVFKEAFPLARDSTITDNERAAQSLDATGIQLENAYLEAADLKQTWMPQANLRLANLSKANLSKANLSDANFEKAILTEADLNGAQLNGARLRDAGLISANLSRSNLSGANLFKANLAFANIREATFIMTELTEANIPKADLRKAKLIWAHFKGGTLMEADLSDADLNHVSLRDVNLRGANLQRANMSEALIVDTSFYEADLRKANLSKSFFTGAYLRKANCREANLQGANLVFANLNEADFSGADFSNAKLFWDDLDEIEFGQTRRIVVELKELKRRNYEYEVDLFLKDTDLRGVKGLTKEQLATCKAKGAIIDEDLIASPSQFTSAPSSLSQSNDIQASPATPAQESTPPPDPHGSNAASSQQEPES